MGTMGFMQKILDALNMDNWRKPQYTLEDKGEPPKNLFWEDTPDIDNFSQDDAANRESEAKQEAPKRYRYVLFSEHVDTSEIIGSRQDFMRRDYTIEPLYYTSCQYLHRLWRCSVDLLKITNAKRFFETFEEFENSLNTTNQYIYGKFKIGLEKENYYSKKDEILIKFLDRSFTDEYRHALELKTVKGRIGRIDHWFFMMDYYKHYLTPNAIAILDALNKRWTMELMPNLLEENI